MAGHIARCLETITLNCILYYILYTILHYCTLYTTYTTIIHGFKSFREPISYGTLCTSFESHDMIHCYTTMCRAVRRGRPLIPYWVASRSEAVLVEAV